jgi:acyl-CoA synthetase (AMP-forming)/AMP-acid ligase II
MTAPSAPNGAWDGNDADEVHRYGEVPWRQRLPGVRSSALDYIAVQAALRPSEPYLTCVDVKSSDGTQTTLNYGQLDLLTQGVAAWIGAHLDSPAAATVGLLPRNDEPSVLALLGLLRSGCRVLVLSPDDPTARIAEQVRALGVRTVIRSPRVSPALWPGAVEALSRAGIPAGDGGPCPRPRLAPWGDALVLSTSGSTASAKMVVQSHRNGAVNAAGAVRHHRLAPADRLLGCLPIHHVNGLHFTLLATLTAGAHAVLASEFDPFNYGRLIEGFRPRIASVVPSILQALSVTWRQPRIPAGFGYFASAAAPLSPAVARAVRARLGTRIVQAYGLTETTNFSTIMPGGLAAGDYARLMEESDIPPVGSEVFGNEVAVLDQDGQRVPSGTVGEVCVRGQSVMSRYEGNQAATAEVFRHGWFHTGDTGFETRAASPGKPLFVLTGRIKNIAKVRGESVSLEEVERAAARLPGIIDAACGAAAHALDGEQLTLAVVVAGEFDEAALRAGLAAMLPAAALPQRVVKAGVIPRTPTGKIIRARLAEELRALR